MNRISTNSRACIRVFATFIAAPAPQFTRAHSLLARSSYEDFEKGTIKGVALRSDGKLVLAPKFTHLADPGLAYLWALRSDSKGNLYAAGGSSAKVLKYDSAGKVTTAFQSNELSAQALRRRARQFICRHVARWKSL